MPARPPKKTETIEIRLPDATKAAFMERCRQDERTASEAIRLFIDGQLAPNIIAAPRRAPNWRIVVAGVLGAAFGIGVAAPSLARSAQAPPPTFERLDRNHDGVLTAQEYQAR
jgi:hypothetical protein